MTVFKYFWRIIAHNIIGVLIYFGIFIGLAILFSGTNQGGFTELEGAKRPVSIINQDHGAFPEMLKTFISDAHEFVPTENDPVEMQYALMFGKVDYILIIPEGFSESFLSGENNVHLEHASRPDSPSAFYINNQIDTFLGTMYTYTNAGVDLQEAFRLTGEDLALGGTVEIMESPDTLHGAVYYQFLPFALMSAVILGLTPVFLVFNKKDVSRRIESAALSLKERNFQIALGCILCALIAWVVFNSIPFVLFGEEMRSAISVLRITNTFVLTIVAVSLAFFLGQIVQNKNALTAATNLIVMGMSFLSGVFVPQEVLGERVLTVARFLPTYWYARSNDVLRGVSVTTDEILRTFWEGTFIQLGFAIAIFAVALVVIRQRKYKSVV